MSKSINTVILLGNVGREPEVKYTPSGTAVASLSIATSERYKDKDGNWQDKSEWHNIKAWARTAEIIKEYVKKGSRLYVEGKLHTESWDDKQTGEKKFRTEVVVEDLVLLSGSPDYAGKEQRQPQRAQQQSLADELEPPF